MAETKTINLKVDTGDSVKAVKDLNKATTDLGATFEEVYGELQPLTTRMGEAEDRMYELSLAGKQNTQEFKDLTAAVGNYKRTQMETDKIVDAAALTMGGKFSGALSGATGAFSSFQGAMGLVGSESKVVEQALLKVQSAMAIQEGLKGIKEGIPAFKAFGASAKAAFTGMKGAIAATGIGVLLIALGAIAANWDSIKGAIGGVTAKQQALTRETQRDLDLQKSKLTRLNQQENALRLQGATEREILVLKIAQTKQIADAGLKQILAAKKNRDEQIEATRRSKENLSNILQFIEQPIDLILKAVDKVRSVMGQKSTLSKDFRDFQSGLIFNDKKVKAEANKGIRAIREENRKVIAEQQALEVQLRAIDKQAAADRLAIKKQANLDRENEQKEADEKFKIDRQKSIDEQAEIAESVKNATEARKQKALTDAADKIKYDKEVNDIMFAAAKKFQEDKDKIAADAEAKRKLRAQQNYDAVKNGLAAINDLTFLFAGKSLAQQKKAFQVQKAVSIAQTLIDTYKSATAAFASLAGTGPQGVVLGGIAAAAAIASGLANVKRISATKFDSGGGGGGSSPSPSGGGGGGGGAPTSGSVTNTVTPNFNIVGANGQNQLNGAMQPIQAFVVSSEITTQQQLDRNKLRNATL